MKKDTEFTYIQFNYVKDHHKLKYDENKEMLIWLTDENKEMLIWLTVTKMYYSLSTRHLDVSCRAWNYNTNRNNMSVNSFIKAYSIPFDMGLK